VSFTDGISSSGLAPDEIVYRNVLNPALPITEVVKPAEEVEENQEYDNDA